MRIALKLAYDGRAFHGFARQPGLRTVEGEVRFALRKAGLIDPAMERQVGSASRTDAGVSALGNVVTFPTVVREQQVIGRFNDAARDAWAWAFARVPDGLDPRRARERWYRYDMLGPHDIVRLRDAARRFVGEHDFAAFASPGERRTRRRVDAIEITAVPDGIWVDVRAPSFLRGMVRRIVAALLAVERGEASPEILEKALAVGRGPDLGRAPPEPLILMDVDLGIPFAGSVDRACRERIGVRLSRGLLEANFWREAAARVGAKPSLNV